MRSCPAVIEEQVQIVFHRRPPPPPHRPPPPPPARGARVTPAPAPPPPGTTRHSHADISDARLDLGYEPSVSFREGLARTLAWFSTRETPS